MRILVTGSQGVIGRVVVPYLANRGYDVITLDIRSGADVVADIRNYEVVKDVVSKVDVVVHLAALTSPVESWERENEYYSINLLGTTTILRSMSKDQMIVFASSCAVYGDIYEELLRPISEADDVMARPLSPYGMSKYLAEKAIYMHHRERGIGYVILRLGNVYSPYDDKYVFSKMLSSRVFNVSDFEAVRDYVSALDLAKLIALVVESWNRGEIEAETFNVGAEPLNLKELVEVFRAYSGKPEYVRCCTGLKRGEFKRMVLDVSKARSKLGWEAELRLSDGSGVRWILEGGRW